MMQTKNTIRVLKLVVLHGQLHQWLVHKLPPSCSHQSVWNERCAVWWLCDFLSKPLEILKSESPIHTFTALVGRATWCFWHGSGIMVWVAKCCKVGFSNFVCKWYPRSFRTLPCLWIQLQYQQTRYNKISNWPSTGNNGLNQRAFLNFPSHQNRLDVKVVIEGAFLPNKYALRGPTFGRVFLWVLHNLLRM